ncbi:MAG TPA: HD-GYP domain-containing protein [Lacipirellulaceae bacterium]|nr:HD-GYP domain-containing protein [Lacipirellulaceae bacterium]
MTSALLLEPLAPAARLALDALQDAFDAAPELWADEPPQGWSRRHAESAESPAAELGCGEVVSEELAGLLEGVRSTSAVRALTSDGVAWVGAPLTDAAGALQAVAVLTVDAAAAPYAYALAQAVLRDLQQRQELEWLRDENHVFSHQVTDDFEELTFLRTMATRLVFNDTTLDIHRIVQHTIGDLREMLGAETIYFVSGQVTGGLNLAQCCPALPADGATVESDVVLRLVAAHRLQTIHGPCVRNDLATADPSAHAAGVRQFLMAPIGIGERQFGWFVAVNRTTIGRHWAPSPLLQLGRDEFGTWEASLLATAATLLASHASNLELLREKEQLLINTVRSLVTALDAKDAYTRGHSERVALFSKRISQSLGYDAAAAERLYLAGLLHDVGKIGVSDATLRKPDKLTDEEFAEIKRHPDEGWAILRDLEQLNYVLPGVLHHHERVGGGGYPDGLVGSEIPLDARIMAVADAYDAMTSDRAYRGGMPHEKAIDILRRGAGTQWDAQVVDTFLAVIDDITAIRYGYHPVERPLRKGSARGPECQGPA